MERSSREPIRPRNTRRVYLPIINGAPLHSLGYDKLARIAEIQTCLPIDLMLFDRGICMLCRIEQG
jgi:hypothetical protein